MIGKILYRLALIALLVMLLYSVASSIEQHSTTIPLVLANTESAVDQDAPPLEQLSNLIRIQPFNLIATIIFLLAIIHTMMANSITSLYEKLSKKLNDKSKSESFWLNVLHFLGEVEIIFGIWAIPLIIAMTWYYNWDTCIDYLSKRDYTEPLFVFVIMAVASTEPILQVAYNALKSIAALFGETATAWWLTILTVGPLAGSLITEPAAMTICSLLLVRQFYEHNPSKMFCYATLGLLFVNISIGGVFTSFAAPPVIMVSKTWGWSTSYMFVRFGFKALLAIGISNFLYYLFFRKELQKLEKSKEVKTSFSLYDKIPVWIVFLHLFTLAWIVIHAHYPAIFLATFVLFLGFCKATEMYQYKLDLKPPFLVGFFLASLVIHGNLQGWWVSPLLDNASSGLLMIISTFLTAFMDNAAITYLASLIPNITFDKKYIVVAGAVTGGGLTVIANAPNLVGQTLIGPQFPKGVSPLYLFLGAIIPTLITMASFYIFRPV